MDVGGSNPLARSTKSRRRRTSGAAVVVLGGALVVAVGCGGRRTEPARAREPSAVGRVWNSGRHAIGVALRHPEDVVEAPPPDAVGRPWVYCEDALSQHGIDSAAENAAALRRLGAASGTAGSYDAIVVPGFTPLDAVAPQTQIHPTAVDRLELAQRDLAAGLAPVILVSGGNVHPDDTPINEALQMKQWLLAHGTPADRVVVEPCARHSHTNLRNAGRFLLAQGLHRALVVTSIDQAMYFGQPRSSSFDGRCLADLGYVVGELRTIDDHRVSFVPSGRTLDRGPDPLDP